MFAPKRADNILAARFNSESAESAWLLIKERVQTDVHLRLAPLKLLEIYGEVFHHPQTVRVQAVGIYQGRARFAATSLR